MPVPPMKASSNTKDACVKTLLERFARILPADISLTVLLAVLIADLFVLQPIEVLSGWAKFLVDLVTILFIILSILAVVGRCRSTVVFVTLTIAALVLRGILLAVPGIGVGYLQYTCALVATGILAWLVLGLVLRSGRVTIHRIQGAVVVYLLLAMMWMQAYRIIALYDPEAFVVMDEVKRVDAEVGSRLAFFSFSVITAASFIDLTPVNPVARSLAMLESLTGQLYLVILIARLVSLEVEARHREGDW
jgi:hypothetical protein